MSPDVHPAAATGFERAADAYERGRPDFPPAAVDALVADLGLGPDRTLLELGAGTGKLTRLLAPSGARIVAVEPVAAMRAVLAAEAPGTEILDATAEALPLAPGEADAAVAAQAFHWFDGPAALAELARVLPGGAPLALVWNVRDESVGWVRGITELIEPFRGDTPAHRSLAWRRAFDDDPAWPPPACTPFPYLHETTPEATVDRVLSISFVAALPRTERAALRDRVRAILPPGERLVFPYRTDVWLTRRR